MRLTPGMQEFPLWTILTIQNSSGDGPAVYIAYTAEMFDWIAFIGNSCIEFSPRDRIMLLRTKLALGIK